MSFLTPDERIAALDRQVVAAHLLLDLTAVSVLEPFSLRQGAAALRRTAS